ncbi:hypothetical protein LINPERPRIM_LOCUS8238 [Linum perenne]
MEFFSEHLW